MRFNAVYSDDDDEKCTMALQYNSIQLSGIINLSFFFYLFDEFIIATTIPTPNEHREEIKLDVHTIMNVLFCKRTCHSI